LATQPPEFYWFEAFEMIRKFTLTGLPLLTRLVSQGSNTESVWGTMLTAAFTVYINSVAPYIDDTDQRLSLCAQFHLVTTMIAGMGNGVMEPSDGSEIFIVLAVIVPAAVLIAILIYGVIDPEYKTWFARKCVLVFWQLQSCATCCAPSDGGSTSGEADGEADGNPVNIAELETRLSKMIAVADEHDGVSRDLAENEENLTSSNVSIDLTECNV
jgi:hypothetical protein